MKPRLNQSAVRSVAGRAPAGGVATCLAAAALATLILTSGDALGGAKKSPADQHADWLTHDDPTATAARPAGPFANRPQDQLWVVSCRGLPGGPAERPTRWLRYAQYQGSGQWLPSDRQSFAAAKEPAAMICVFVAGNGYADGETRALGRSAYQGLTRGASTTRPIRFVIWSWPSDHADNAMLQDLRIKAARTDRAAWHLAEWLHEAARDSDVSLIGASFGVRIAGGALHLLGGGRLGGYALTQGDGPLRPMPALFISPAIDDDWLLPGHRFGRAMSQVERLLLVNNSSDRMLKRYHWLYGRRSPAQALGRGGLAASRLGDDRDKISQLDAAAVIGPAHGCGPYFQAPSLLARMRPYAIAVKIIDGGQRRP